MIKSCGNPTCKTENPEKLKNCGGCRRVAYCSVACQKAHWKDHKVLFCFNLFLSSKVLHILQLLVRSIFLKYIAFP